MVAENTTTFRTANGRNRQLSGFTLIEALMVIVLIGIALGVSVPYMVNSIRGQRVRTASRTLVMSVRYARSMAVLQQTDVSMTFDFDTGGVRVTSEGAGLPSFARELEGVRLVYVKVKDDEPVTEGSCVVVCRQSGVCDPFEAKVEDIHGNYNIIKVDALGSARTRNE